jgi:hypothetical protein
MVRKAARKKNFPFYEMVKAAEAMRKQGGEFFC